LVSKSGNIDDLIQALVKKAHIADEEEAGKIRVFESSNHRFTRELPRDYSVLSMNEYTTFYAERLPEEEVNAEESNFISVFHFQSEPSRTHGVPFKFLLLEVSFQRLSRLIMLADRIQGREVCRHKEAAGEAHRLQGQEL